MNIPTSMTKYPIKNKTCGECEGTGQLEYEVPIRMSFSNPYGELTTEWGECYECGGSGEVPDHLD